IPEILNLASKRLRASRQDIFEALPAEEVTPAHCFCLAEVMAHIEELESRMVRFDAELIRSLEAGVFARETPGCVACCASLHRQQDAADVRSKTSSRL
ncbi:MAG: hypothetical protein RIR45_840, partial [Pseudomonadota bacterium]